MREAHAHGRNSWGSVTRQWILNADIITRGKMKYFCVGKRAPRACGLAADPCVRFSSFASWQPTQAWSEGRVRLTFTCPSLRNGASEHPSFKKTPACRVLGTGQACILVLCWGTRALSNPAGAGRAKLKVSTYFQGFAPKLCPTSKRK